MSSNLKSFYEKYKILYHLFVKDIKKVLNQECKEQKINVSLINKLILDFRKNETNYLIFEINEINLENLSEEQQKLIDRYVDTFKKLSLQAHEELTKNIKENPTQNPLTNILENSNLDIQNMMGVMDDIGFDMKSLLEMLDKQKKQIRDKIKDIENPLSLEGMMECVQAMKPMIEDTISSFMKTNNVDEDDLSKKLENKLPEMTKMLENLQENPQIKSLMSMVQDKDGNMDIIKMMSNFGLENKVGNALGIDDNEKMGKIMKGFTDYMNHNPNPNDNNKNTQEQGDFGNIMDMVKNMQNMILPKQKKTIQDVQREKEQKKLEKQRKRLAERKKKQDKLKDNKSNNDD